jgi:hypothetical protein
MDLHESALGMKIRGSVFVSKRRKSVCGEEENIFGEIMAGSGLVTVVRIGRACGKIWFLDFSAAHH